MKKSIANKIELLLAALTGNDLSSNTSDGSNKEATNKNSLSARNIGKFCRNIPMTIFNLIRPAQHLDLK